MKDIELEHSMPIHIASLSDAQLKTEIDTTKGTIGRSTDQLQLTSAKAYLSALEMQQRKRIREMSAELRHATQGGFGITPQTPEQELAEETDVVIKVDFKEKRRLR